MEVSYSLFLRELFGPISGATMSYQNGFVPPSKEYRMHLNLEEDEYVEFGIAHNHEGMIFDPQGAWVKISLSPDEYIKSGSSHLEKDDYESLCHDLILLARNRGWKLLGNKEEAPAEIQDLFAEP